MLQFSIQMKENSLPSVHSQTDPSIRNSGNLWKIQIQIQLIIQFSDMLENSKFGELILN